MVTHEDPDDSNTVVSAVGLGLPVDVSERVLEESSNVFECSPSLSFISGLGLLVNELAEFTVGFLGKSSKDYKVSLSDKQRNNNSLSGCLGYLPANHVSALIDVRDTVEEAFNTGKSLSEMGLGVLAIVEILCHITIN